MSLSKTEIANLALDVGGLQLITNLDTENSVNARLCRRWYDHSRRALLEAHYWRFAKERRLLVQRDETVSPEWTYSYAHPPQSDVVALRYIEPSSGLIDFENLAPFEVVGGESTTGDTDVLRILTNEAPGCYGVFTRNVENTAIFPALFSTALAAAIAVRIYGSKVRKRDGTRDLAQEAANAMDAAMAGDSQQAYKRRRWTPAAVAARS